jgi:hypothetical protein
MAEVLDDDSPTDNEPATESFPLSSRKALQMRVYTANGIRTRVTAVRGRRPSPLDDGGPVSPRGIEASKPSPSDALQTANRNRFPAPELSAREAPRAISSTPDHADVAELVDAHGSGPCGCKSVEVRVLSSAFRQS